MKKLLLFFLFSFSILGTSLAQDKVYGLLFKTVKYSNVYDVFGINTYIGYYDQGNYPTEDFDEYISAQNTPQTTYHYTTLGNMTETNPIVVHHEMDEITTYVDVQDEIPWDMKIFFYPDDPNNPDDVGSVKFEYIDAYHGECEMVQNQRFPISSQIRYICSQTDNGDSGFPGDPIFFKYLYFLHIWNEGGNICENDEIVLNYGWDWQYSYNGGTWTTLTNHAGERTLRISPSDILPPGTSSGQLRFKTGYNGNWLENNIVIFDIYPSPPSLVSPVEVVNPSCPRATDGGFVLHLDRNQQPGEVLHIQGKKDGQVDFTYDSTSNNVVWSSNTVTVNNLGKGNYTNIQYYVLGANNTNNNTSCLADINDITLTDPDTLSIDHINVTNNVICNGDSNGSINIGVKGGSWDGGTVSYSYKYNLNNGSNWTNWINIPNGQNLNYQTGEIYSFDINYLAAGHYNILVRADNGRGNCAIVNPVSFTITQPDEVQVIQNIVNPVSCYGGNDGSITINVSGGSQDGGTVSYLYSFDDGNTWVDIPNGQNLSYQAGVNFSFDIINLSPGHYDLKIGAKANGGSVVCSGNSISFDIIEPNKVIFSASKTDVTCHGENNGTITINSISGGTGAYSYFLGNGVSIVQYTQLRQIPFTISGLEPGTYQLYIKDSNDCIGYANPPGYNDEYIEFEISEPAELTLDINKTDVTCNGGSDGKLTLTASGGAGDYQYQIDNGSWTHFTNLNTTEIMGLNAGTYNVYVKDRNNCEIQKSIKVDQPDAINIQFNSMVAPSPGQSNGRVKALITGGTPLLNNGNLTTTSYTCTWYDDNNQIITSNNEIINGEFYTGISNVPAGDYRVEITDKNNCSSTNTISLNVINVVLQISNPIACHGGTGTIEASASGGDGNYSYEWYKDNVLISGLTSATASGLTTGTYKVVLTDSSGATASDTITLSEPSLLVLDSFNTQNVSCFGGADGEAEVNVSGGTSSYNYEWHENINGQWQVRTDIGNTNIATNLQAGNYRVVVTDAHNCILQYEGNDFVQFSITQPQNALQINLVDAVPESFPGAADASISISVQGGTPGTPPYTLTCQDANLANFPVTDLGNNQYRVSNISNGSYTIDVTDANLCLESLTVNIDFEVSLSVQDTIYCNGGLGTLSATASGGSGTYTNYQWYEIDNGQGNLIPNQNSSTLQVPAGTYKVCVSDDNHRVCSPAFDLPEPQAIDTTQVNITDVSCFGGADGSIHIEVSGGYSGQYEYQWYGPNSFTANTQDIRGLEDGNYRVEIKDAQHKSCMVLIDNLEVSQPASAISINNAVITNVNHIGQPEGAIDFEVSGGLPPYTYSWNGPNGFTANTQDISDLEAGTYEVTITDASNCSYTNQFPITQPDGINFDIYYSDILCNGGTTEVSLQKITGGSLINGEDYTGKWYDNANNLIGSGLSQTLPAGNYQVEVLDSYQNTTTQSFTISEPEAISATYTVQDVSCFNTATGSINLSVSGGTPFSTGNPYRYSWTDNHGNSGVDLDNLYAGTYDVKIVDANNCSLAIQGIIIRQSSPISIEVVDFVSPTSGQQDGLIRITVSGGNPGYTYQWLKKNETTGNFEIISGATTNVLSNIGEGNYKVEVTDSQNCTETAIYNLGVLQPMTVTINQISNIGCYGGNDASLEAITTGGAGGYQYVWYDGNAQVISSVSSQTISGLPAGEYYVEVSDLRGNTVTSDHITVSQPNEMEVQAQTSYTGCGNDKLWNIDLDIQGGTPPYIFDWNTGDTTQNLSQVSAGNYLVVITDNNGCQQIFPVIINQPDAMQVTESIQQPSCYNSCDGSISLSIMGGMPPYDVQWSNAVAGENIQDLCPGTYIATITDSDNCVFNYSYDLLNPDSIPLNLAEEYITCGNNPVSFDITISDPNATYQWTGPNGFMSNSPIVQLYDEGDYTATITNSSNCTATAQVHISKIENTYHTDFLVATQVYENEEVVLVNTSNPIPQNTTWVVPSSVQIISETDERIILKFPLAGFYDIGLRSSYSNGCFQDYTKTIIVNEQSNLPDNGSTDLPFILDFSVYPNPTTGVFTATVHLQSQATITLKLYSLVTNVLLDARTLNGVLDLNETYQLQLPAGIYVLLLETPHGSEIRKVIVQ